MTCIVGIVEKNGNIIMGADKSASSPNNSKYNLTNDKVFRRGPFLFGVSDSYRGMQILQYGVELPRIDDLTEEEYIKKIGIEAYLFLLTDNIRKAFNLYGHAQSNNLEEICDTVVLIGAQGRLFKIQTDFSFFELQEGYISIGSGDVVAFGSLYETSKISMSNMDRVISALRCAEHFNNSVNGPFDILQLDKDGVYCEDVEP